MLVAIKLAHTIIRAFWGGSILTLPVVAALRRFHLAATLSGLLANSQGYYACNLRLQGGWNTMRYRNPDLFL
jgi:hypothetical protein